MYENPSGTRPRLIVRVDDVGRPPRFVQRIRVALDRLWQLLYPDLMSTQVIVVKRSRRRLFAGPRALPDWLRSIWVARTRHSERTSDSIHSFVGSQDLDAPFGPTFPGLDFDSSGAHRCSACDLCVRACPSRCLRMTAEGEGESRRPTTFEIARANCIGCGVCREVCPENAIEMLQGPNVERVVGEGRSLPIDLLTVAS